MKKFFTVLILSIFISPCFADLIHNPEEGLTWAEYELQSFKLGIEPTWEHYLYLLENPQCYDGFEELEEIKNLMEIINEN